MDKCMPSAPYPLRFALSPSSSSSSSPSSSLSSVIISRSGRERSKHDVFILPAPKTPCALSPLPLRRLVIGREEVERARKLVENSEAEEDVGDDPFEEDADEDAVEVEGEEEEGVEDGEEDLDHAFEDLEKRLSFDFDFGVNGSVYPVPGRSMQSSLMSRRTAWACMMAS